MSKYVPTPNYALAGNYWIATYWLPWYWVGGALLGTADVEAMARGLTPVARQRVFSIGVQARGSVVVERDRP